MENSSPQAVVMAGSICIIQGYVASYYSCALPNLSQTYVRIWSWFAGAEKPGVFEIDWQEYDGVNRIAMALECRQVAVLDVNKLDAFRTAASLHPGERRTASRIEEVNV